MRTRLIAAVLLTAAGFARADGPADNLPDKVRRVPPPGIKIPDADRAELAAGVEALGAEIDVLAKLHAGDAGLRALLPDVRIYHNAVRYALRHDEFYKPAEIPIAKTLLKQGMERAAALKDRKHPWTSQTGLIARGYASKIDGSVQPYGLLVPAAFGQQAQSQKFRLDLWCHGRGEQLTELSFINNVQKSGGQFLPKDGFVLQLYGRYCCANKFAGEIDALEAMEAVKKSYPIDENRVVVRGFSMGGAACWQFAVHYTDLWAAAAPGAGFSETADFLKVFQNEPQKPTWYEQKLWRWYDCTDSALNLFNLPTVAYSGEIDKQKQAADMMEAAMKKEGLTLTHIIGPKTGHSYHKDSVPLINKFVDDAVAKGRNQWPKQVKLVTYTLRYNRMYWLHITGLEKHWERSQAVAGVVGDAIRISTTGVTSMWVEFTGFPDVKKVVIDGDEVKRDVSEDGKPLALGIYYKLDGHWKSWTNLLGRPEIEGLRKTPDLQGPIDDAFMDSFAIVAPTGKPLNEAVGKWAAGEQAHAVEHWRRQFRGDARVITDEKVGAEEIASHNLVLFGDPQSNKVLAKIADKLPIKWTADGIVVGDKKYAADKHVPVLIFPNPLNPKRYVVINSGFTFREYDYLNNARQIAKLPDWAVVDIGVPVTSRAPGGIVEAGFFGEKWELQSPVK